jgi:hypothetical protein
MAKTAMQELIEWAKNEAKISLTLRDAGGVVAFEFVKDKATELLAQERKQIEDAYTNGNRQEFYDGSETLASDYYTKTYNDEK